MYSLNGANVLGSACGLGPHELAPRSVYPFFSELTCLYSKNTNIRTYYGTCNICVAIGRIYAMHAMWPYNADDQLRNQDVQSRAAEQLLDLVSQKRREIKMWMTGLQIVSRK